MNEIASKNKEKAKTIFTLLEGTKTEDALNILQTVKINIEKLSIVPTLSSENHN